YNGVLLMELVVDESGNCAPRLGEVDLSPELARTYHQFLIRQVVCMLCSGLIHGDLSEFNVLVGVDGPVIIDLPQAVNAAGNNNAFAMLKRDVENISATLSRFAPELGDTRFAPEMWMLFEQGLLKPDTVLTGIHIEDQTAPDLEQITQVIEDAREEAIRREIGRRQSEEQE